MDNLQEARAGVAGPDVQVAGCGADAGMAESALECSARNGSRIPGASAQPYGVFMVATLEDDKLGRA